MSQRYALGDCRTAVTCTVMVHVLCVHYAFFRLVLWKTKTILFCDVASIVTIALWIYFWRLPDRYAGVGENGCRTDTYRFDFVVGTHLIHRNNHLPAQLLAIAFSQVHEGDKGFGNEWHRLNSLRRNGEMMPDPTIACIWEARHRISEKCGHDHEEADRILRGAVGGEVSGSARLTGEAAPHEGR